MNMTRVDFLAFYELALADDRVHRDAPASSVIAINDPGGETWEVAKTAITNARNHDAERNGPGDDVTLVHVGRTPTLNEILQGR